MQFNLRKIAAVLVFSLLSAQSYSQIFSDPAKPAFARRYTIGETYRYKLVLNEYNNGELQFTNISVCELHVIDSNRMAYDEVRWLSKKMIRGKDTIDQTPMAVSAKPYRLSLAGFGKVDLPKIEKPEMTEPLQDFNTFFAAINPGFSMMGKRFTQVGDSVAMKSPTRGNFSNGSTIPRGEDCLSIGVKITGATDKETHLYSSFMPSAKPCFSFILNDMNTPVVPGSPNNFQMVSPAGNNLFNLMYGREFFYINTTLRNADGKILHAEMYNQLNVKIKHNCDGNYQGCQVETPFGEVRKLTLELLAD